MEKWFAWYPVQLENGKWVFWKWIWRRLNIEMMRANEMIGLVQTEWIYSDSSD